MSSEQTISPERIAEIGARAKAATKGPWYVHHDSFTGRTSVSTWAAPITERVACNIAGPMVHRADAEFIADAPQAIRDLLLALDAAQVELSLGHLRIDECADGAATKGQPIRERISAKIQSLVEELTERGHIIAACAAEKDELRAQAQSAKHREAAAEYRAQRIVLDEELRKRAEVAEAELARLRAQGTDVASRLEMACKRMSVGSGARTRFEANRAGQREAYFASARLVRELFPAPPDTEGA